MNEPARVVGTITPRAPFGIDPPESPAERAAHAALMALADLYLVLSQVGTVQDALRLERIATEASEQFAHVARSALLKSDALCGTEVVKPATTCFVSDADYRQYFEP